MNVTMNVEALERWWDSVSRQVLKNPQFIPCIQIDNGGKKINILVKNIVEVKKT